MALWQDPEALEGYLDRQAPDFRRRLADVDEPNEEFFAGVYESPAAERDPAAVVRFLARYVPERPRVAGLLAIAGEFDDEEAAALLYVAAGRLVESAGADLATVDLLRVATAYARWEPRRAGPWADRVRRAVPGADHWDLLGATVLAVLLHGFDPARATRLLDAVEHALRTEEPDARLRSPVAVAALARIALAARPMSEGFTARVLTVAHVTAKLADEGLRKDALTAYAVQLAELGGPPAAISEAVTLIASPFHVGYAWWQVLTHAAYTDPAELAEVLDHAEVALVQRRGRQGRLSGLRGRLEGAAGDRYPAWFVRGVARHDLARAQAAAEQLTDAAYRASAQLALATAASATDLATARVHLSAAYQAARTAQDLDDPTAHQVMADLATAATRLDPALARRAARHLDAWARSAAADGAAIAELARAYVPSDAAAAERFLALAAEHARIDGDYWALLTTLAALAGHYAAGADPRTKDMADRILAASRSIVADRERASAWAYALPELVTRNPKMAGTLAGRFDGADRPALVGVLAPALARSDPERAEALARTLPNAASRDLVRAEIVRQSAVHALRDTAAPAAGPTRLDPPLPPAPTWTDG